MIGSFCSRKNRLFAVFLLALICLIGFPGSASLASAQEGKERGTTPDASSAETRKASEGGNEAYRHSAMVKKLGSMMGLETETAATAFEVANFALLAALVGFALVKTLPKTFRDRTSGIQKQLVDARAATEEASVRLNSVEDRLARLDGQIAELRGQAEKDSLADYARIKAAMEEESKKILASAELEIAAAQQEAQRQLQRYAAELAIEQAARKLVVSAETDRLLVQSFARRLGVDGAGSKGGEN